ncbi:hypothetical protein ACQFX9_04620 [Aliinostoc sp. HNIBRCY26]|uniref:hypothetical protein n=1 Tax=Aliinostoc sp. HNIBRCY26 TaxID=3418997 RepID=UPI003D04C497
MESSTKSPFYWLEKVWQSHFQAILIVCFLIWTSLLATTTLKVQHSCHPMIHWSGDLPIDCMERSGQKVSSTPKENSTTQTQPKYQNKTETSNYPKIPSKKSSDTHILAKINNNPDVTAGAIAIGVATSIALIASSPLAVVLGSGFVTWLAIRTVLSIGAH